jgi:serine/threonine protein phosphatase PrpC
VKQDKDIVQMPIDPSAPNVCCVGVFDGHGGETISTAVCVFLTLRDALYTRVN